VVILAVVTLGRPHNGFSRWLVVALSLLPFSFTDGILTPTEVTGVLKVKEMTRTVYYAK